MGFFWLGSFSAFGTGGTSCLDFSRRFLLFFLVFLLCRRGARLILRLKLHVT